MAPNHALQRTAEARRSCDQHLVAAVAEPGTLGCMNNRREQLENLHAHLGELVEVFAQDPLCQWRKHFVASQQRAASLLSHGFTQSELNELSGSVSHVFGGAGSFNDHAPVRAKADGTFGPSQAWIASTGFLATYTILPLHSGLSAMHPDNSFKADSDAAA